MKAWYQSCNNALTSREMLAMFTTVLISLCSFFQSQVTIVKDNGETAQLTNLSFYQKKDSSTKTTLSYFGTDGNKSIDISQLKRINFKELISRNKGVQRWNVILVTKSNAKHDVEMDLVQVEGIDAQGKQEAIGAGSIDKITL